MSTYADVIDPGFGTGKNFMPGLSQVIYFASVNDIATFAKPAASPATENLKYTVETDFVMKSGKKFHKMYTGIEAGQVAYESLGNREGGGYHITATGFMPGDSDDVNYFVNEAQGDRFIVIVKRANGEMELVGTEDFPATIRSAFDSQTVTGDASGYTTTIEAYQPNKLRYTGDVPLTAAA